MSALTNDAATLRFTLTPAGDGLASAAIEFFDARDKTFWPLVQLPVLHLHTGQIRDLARMTAPLLEGKTDSFAWRGGHGEEVALSVARSPEEGRWIVEVGIDLSAYLRETAHLFIGPRRELALFRFHATAVSLQEFSAGLAC
jgi:hypothetical protein